MLLRVVLLCLQAEDAEAASDSEPQDSEAAAVDTAEAEEAAAAPPSAAAAAAITEPSSSNNATAPKPPPSAAAAAAGAKLTQEETSATGGVSAAVVWAYMSALGGLPTVLLLVGGFVTTELLRVGATVWLSVWTGKLGRVRQQWQQQQHRGAP